MVLLLSHYGNDSAIYGTLGMCLAIAFFAFYLFLCWLVGRYAKRHGRSFWGFFLLSIFINPLFGFIVAAIFGGETEKQRMKRIKLETEYRMQLEEQYRQQHQAQPQTPPPFNEEGTEQ